MLDPNQYLRMRNLFGAMPNPSTPDMGPGGLTAPSIVPNMNIASPQTPQSLSVPNQPPNMPPGPQQPPPTQGMPPGMPNAALPPPTSSMTPTNPNFTSFEDYDVGKRMSQLYHPETDSYDKFNAMIKEMPKYVEPTRLKRLGASLLSAGSYLSDPRNTAGGPADIMKAAGIGGSVLNAPYQRAMGEWQAQIKPMEQAASLERYQNVSNRQMAFQTVSDELKSQAQLHRTENDAVNAEIKEHRAQIYELKAKGWDFDFKGPTIIAHNPEGQIVNTGWKTHEMSELDKMNLSHTNKLSEIDEAGRAKQAAQTANEKWSLMEIQDPDSPDTSKKITVRVSPDASQIQRVKLVGGGQIGPIQKPGTDKGDLTGEQLTAQTKTMMEGAQMMLPHIKELRDQATELQKRGLFGPAMSRIRDMAGKLGTTGMSVESLDPDEVNGKLNRFNDALTKDPYLSTDALVGQFATTLGLMTSGMGRVHGGARGGGSIQMINYLKSLLSSDSTIDMFGGRLKAVESFLKTYAAGPKSKTSTKLDQALDSILGPAPQ
jgi:hypothetical protein